VLGFVLVFAAAALAPAAPAGAQEQATTRKPGGPPVPEEAGSVAGYRQGFFIQGTGSPFELRLQMRFQTRFALEMIENAADKAAFSVPVAQLALGGHVFTKALTYKFQMDFGHGSGTVRDYFTDYAFLPGRLVLRVGQSKRPFSRQQITPRVFLDLMDRAITHQFFGAGRDIGIVIHNDIEQSPAFEYAIGLFNGTGDRPLFSGVVTVDPMTGQGKISEGRFSNVPNRFHPAAVLRLGYNHGGIRGYREGDLEGGSLRFAIGASGLADLDADGDAVSGMRCEVDYALKIHGFSTTGAVYVSSSQSGTRFVDQAYAAVGFHAQAGYLIAGRFQPTFRYAAIAPDGENNDLQEIMGGVTVYFFQHNFKWQTDGGTMTTDQPDGPRTNYLVRTQLQLAF
jgi:hypothetical protein